MSSYAQPADIDLTPACLGNSYPFDVLIDMSAGVIWRNAREMARDICNTGGEDGNPCPLRSKCLTENAAEPWAQAIREEPKITRDCGACGKSFVIKHRGAARRYCNDNCSLAARRARGKLIAGHEHQSTRTLDMPDDIREAHAAYNRLRTSGADIPMDIREGERAYQQIRHHRRIARRDAAA